MPRHDAPDVAFYPPVLFAGAPIAAMILDWIIPLDILGKGPIQIAAGFVILIVAMTLGLWGIVAFNRAGTNVSPHASTLIVVTDGPYRFTRNPMYLGIALFQLGLGLAASLDWSVIIAPLVLAALHYGVVLREEAYLTAKFGAPYTEYLDKTRRWL